MNSQHIATNQYMGTADAAGYVGLGVSTLEKLRLTGGGPRYSRPIKRVLYSVRDLDEWLASHRRRSTSDAE
ncbi:helix-turn-helix transcriptional regulator [Prosthecodimorpha staleyi]|uniref:Helix-turn-helix domain-containing protein n=1 Tax=Prosthecodimorpha staleyi TaxID=2840188 RepID=A0A947DD15_9HYPH|nr:helix-turn-helix domain-containing protein [Prosthecodimorpha staleyi]MBT9292964.1 helix-turn-helix domain-containing protein [Prosthecodimorpha staleyi]